MGLIPRLENLLDHALLLAYPFCLLPIFLLLWTRGKHQKQLRTALRGCMKLGLHGSSNLSDEYHPKYTKSNPHPLDGTSTEPWQIKALFVYPVKSCAPVELDTADISSTGLTWDRQFCFAEYTVPTLFPTGTPDSEKKKPRWTFRTLRKPGYERLVHVRPEIWVPDPQYARMNNISDPNLAGVLVINYPNIPRGTLPTRLLYQTGQLLHLIPQESSPPPEPGLCARRRRAGEIQHPAFLGAAFPAQHPHHRAGSLRRRQLERRACASSVPNNSTISTTPKIEPKNRRTSSSSSSSRAAAAAAVKPSDPQPVDFHTACHTLRCRLPNVDPLTGIRHPAEPDRTLKSFRCIDRGDERNAALGLQLVPARPGSQDGRDGEEGKARMKIGVGDEIEVLDRGELVYVKY
ncbi:hypothetical protein EPUS_02239 [Endocarpon pusillum Z07020]|uniref:Molybdenum cofactor sulfurase middle domain-containing protein n=1 Tax=Endocarpon pusillum (strain Z07020 / HMAS-L-300199) TaxID=1263415 RepID=U1I0H5_ENDPU|nr:uncharacterized protein EPUS_02239 [Endocarpon pusillum Z07020]ERF76700.1 hypothetical protein EPUS_02239 [Endocarpon pusillum Z07020]